MTDLIELDTSVFYWINHHYNPVADWVLWIASQHWAWACVLIVAFCLTTLRREPGKRRHEQQRHRDGYYPRDNLSAQGNL